MFDIKTQEALKYYVYMLIDPAENRPFYVGKGVGNRIFNHLECALNDAEAINTKYERIRQIIERGQKVKHVIIRHGLSETEAFQIEAALIDSLNYSGYGLTNLVGGHNSIEKGLMTTEEIGRLYNAAPLQKMDSDCVMININKSYKRGNDFDPIYQATKETWLINPAKLPTIKYVLSEYRGLIVEVFEVQHWYTKKRFKNKTIDKAQNIKAPVEVIGYGFNGMIAPTHIRDQYINKSVAHLKKKGAAQVIRYNL